MSRRIALVLALLLVGGPATAAEFKPGRGLSLDLWLTWPEEARWGERDVILPFPEWRRTIGAGELRALKAAGLDFLRIPVDPAVFLAPSAAALRDDLADGVVAAVDAVNDAGLKAIVDFHTIPAEGRSADTGRILADDALFAAYAQALAFVAARLAGHDPDVVALEVMNEPVTGCAGDEAAAFADHLLALHRAARAAAPRLTLVLSGACWGSAEGLTALDPARFGDDNLIWSFHSYEPFLLTHQGAEWAGDFIRYVTGLPFPLDSVPRPALDAALDAIRARIADEAPALRRSGMLAYLDEQVGALDTAAELDAAIEAPFGQVAAWARRHGIAPDAVLLGEFGMIRRAWTGQWTVPAAERAAYYRAVIGHAEAHGFAWSMWSYGSDFGVVDEFSGRRAEPDVIDMVATLPPR